MVHTCPRCELRFTTDAELTDHLDIDHHADTAAFERFHYRPAPARPPGRRYLVVANQTLLDDALLDTIRRLADDGAHFHIVVPATPTDPTAEGHDEEGVALATYRVRRLVDLLLDSGIIAEGEVGDPQPIKAIARALDHEPADEVVVSALPEGLSHWIKVGLPDQVARRFHLPVQVVTASVPQ